MNELAKYKTYIFLFLFPVVLLSLKSSQIASIRAPYLSLLKALQAPDQGKEARFIELEENLSLLASENATLKKSLRECYEIIDQFHLIQAKKSLAAAKLVPADVYSKETMEGFEKVKQALPARVYARPYEHWASYLWVDVGTNVSKGLSTDLIGKNSPVVIGDNLVGVVEEVYPSCAKIRLITDGNLYPSVRVARGGAQTLLFDETLVKALELASISDTGLDPKEKEVFVALIKKMRQQTSPKATKLLAKGILQGAGGALWHKKKALFTGKGFNYDFADFAGPALDLATGLPYDEGGAMQNGPPIIQEGDILVTTGLDGIFPPGFKAGLVTFVSPFEEGSFYYTLEAKPLFNPDNLTTVFILPPTETI